MGLLLRFCDPALWLGLLLDVLFGRQDPSFDTYVSRTRPEPREEHFEESPEERTGTGW